MADTEVKVKKAPEKEVSVVSPWAGLETSLFGRNFFEMSPFALMRRFTEEMDRFFNGKTIPSVGLWAPAVEVKEEGGKLCIMAELPGMKKEDRCK
jgi:HSP20 family molecular chaperone IbpA